MTLDLELSNKRIWKCDICGKRAPWSDGWYTCASLLFMDSMPPEEVPTVCSDRCRDEFEKRIKSGEIKMVNIKARGYTISETGERHGY